MCVRKNTTVNTFAQYLFGQGDDFWQEVDFQFQHISSASTSGSGAFNGEDTA